MFSQFNVYDLFLLSFVQLVLTTLLVLSPAREFGARVRWKGSKIVEVFPSVVGTIAIAVLSCFVTHEIWGLSIGGLTAAAYPLVVFSLIVVVLRPDCGVVGQIFYGSYAAAGFAFLGFAAYVAVAATHSIAEAITSSLLLVLDLAAFVVWTSNINYVSDVLCRTKHSRPLTVMDPSYKPMVSLHIPAYNEPPELLINTIKAAEQIDYPDYEIVVIDNNTKDPAVYGPVEEYCRDRERVRFVHVAPWPGYKAGACNLALRRYTNPRAEIIGLIDADDIVEPHYLRETVPYFSDPQLGFVQTFEGNREYQGSAYYTACVDSYQAFYLMVMSSRNERDSVPFVGTMGLFRRSTLVDIGGWNEWCISEDTEASLRASKAGWGGMYVPRCFGRGVVPPSYAGLSTQRHRWCYGAMQIFRLHWRSLMPWDRSPDNHLSSAQRRDYLMACLSWTRDLLMLFFALLLLVVTGLRLANSGFALTPLSGDRSLLPISLILIATLSMTWTLRYWTTMSHKRAVLGLLISLAAGWITALACIEGMIRRDGVFLRTSKSSSDHHRLRAALRLTRWELLLGTALFAAAAIQASLRHPPWLLVFIISFQGLVYMCAPIASVWNLRAQRVPSATYRERFEQRRLRLAARRRPQLRVLRPATATLLALGLGGFAGAFVAPTGLLRFGSVRHPVTAQGLLHSTVTNAYIKLGSESSRSAPFYSVSSVNLSQGTVTRGAAVRFQLSLATFSLPLLDQLVGDISSGHVPGLTLVVRKPASAGHSATTEWAGDFASAQVVSFGANLSGTAGGNMTFSLSGLGHVLASPHAAGLVGSFPPAMVAPGPTVTNVYVKLYQAGSGSSSYYLVSSAQLYRVTPSKPNAPVEFALSFTTSSLGLLNAVVHEATAGESATAVSLLVREPAHDDLPPITVWQHSFGSAQVTSFGESLSGRTSGRVTLQLGS